MALQIAQGGLTATEKDVDGLAAFGHRLLEAKAGVFLLDPRSTAESLVE